MTQPNLLPCPFCGAAPFTQEHPPHKHFLLINGEPFPEHRGSFTIECNCGCGLIDDTLEAVATRWNTRMRTPHPIRLGQKELNDKEYMQIYTAALFRDASLYLNLYKRYEKKLIRRTAELKTLRAENEKLRRKDNTGARKRPHECDIGHRLLLQSQLLSDLEYMKDREEILAQPEGTRSEELDVAIDRLKYMQLDKLPNPKGRTS